MFQVNQLKGLKEGCHGDGQGLYLQVVSTGRKDDEGKAIILRSWLFRYQRHGRRRAMGLGRLAEVGLAEARRKAQDARETLASGLDPIKARDDALAVQRAADASSVAFRDAAESFIDDNEIGWRNGKHRQQWRNTLATYAYPVIGKLPVSEIDTALVLKVLRPIWHTKPETASRVRGRIERVLSAAKVRGLRSGDNPAMWRGHLDSILQAKTKIRRVRHQPALPYNDVPQLMRELEALDSISARALSFCILTATRTCETIGAKWHEFDLDNSLWTIPADRMKAEHEHRVPLSDAAVAIVAKMAETRISAYVFPGWKHKAPLSDMAMLEVLRGVRPGYTVHGFRSSFRDWAGEETNHPHDICEAALAHTRKDKTHAAYQRGDLLAKRRRLMDAWDAFLAPSPSSCVRRATSRDRRRASGRDDGAAARAGGPLGGGASSSCGFAGTVSGRSGPRLGCAGGSMGSWFCRRGNGGGGAGARSGRCGSAGFRFESWTPDEGAAAVGAGSGGAGWPRCTRPCGTSMSSISSASVCGARTLSAKRDSACGRRNTARGRITRTIGVPKVTL